MGRPLLGARESFGRGRRRRVVERWTSEDPRHVMMYLARAAVPVRRAPCALADGCTAIMPRPAPK